jgi:hypothetical protein
VGERYDAGSWWVRRSGWLYIAAAFVHNVGAMLVWAITGVEWLALCLAFALLGLVLGSLRDAHVWRSNRSGWARHASPPRPSWEPPPRSRQPDKSYNLTLDQYVDLESGTVEIEAVRRGSLPATWPQPVSFEELYEAIDIALNPEDHPVFYGTCGVPWITLSRDLVVHRHCKEHAGEASVELTSKR